MILKTSSSAQSGPITRLAVLIKVKRDWDRHEKTAANSLLGVGYWVIVSNGHEKCFRLWDRNNI
jgi:hypothetical protein